MLIRTSLSLVAILLVTFISFGCSYLLTYLTIKLYNKLNLLDDPKKKKNLNVIHKYPVPRGGGLPIFFTILISIIIFIPVDKHLLGIIIGSLLILLIGICDDVYDLSPYLRLVIGLLAAVIVVGFGNGIPFITNPLGGVVQLDTFKITIFLFGESRTIWILADIFAILWINWFMNFVNWSKGIDGQLPGIVVIASLTIGLFTLRFRSDPNQITTILLALIVASAYLGFLPWNFYPQKIMPGYGGGALAGFYLAILTIFSTTKVGTGIMVLAVPMIDALYSMLRRIRKGRSPVWGDNEHLHHKLIELGWTKKKIALFYWFISVLFGILALTLNSKAKLYTIILLVLIFGGVVLWMNYFITYSSRRDRFNG